MTLIYTFSFNKSRRGGAPAVFDPPSMETGGVRRRGGRWVALFVPRQRDVDETSRSLGGSARRHRACGGVIGGGALSLLLSLSGRQRK